MPRTVGNEDSVLGVVPSFAVPYPFMSGPGPMALSPAVVGSNQGVPGVERVAGSSDSSQSAYQYGQDKVGASPANQPLFWLFVMFAIGVVMVAHIAHFNIHAAK